jgi:hypothetical protein
MHEAEIAQTSAPELQNRDKSYQPSGQTTSEHTHFSNFTLVAIDSRTRAQTIPGAAPLRESCTSFPWQGLPL